jgi:hypothetical protein
MRGRRSFRGEAHHAHNEAMSPTTRAAQPSLNQVLDDVSSAESPITTTAPDTANPVRSHLTNEGRWGSVLLNESTPKRDRAAPTPRMTHSSATEPPGDNTRTTAHPANAAAVRARRIAGTRGDLNVIPRSARLAVDRDMLTRLLRETTPVVPAEPFLELQTGYTGH